jgi:hypothetical protein
MAENKNRVQAGHLLKNEDGVCIYNVSTLVNTWADSGSFDHVTAAFSSSHVAVRIVHGFTSYHEAVSVSQIALTREDFQVLLASYRAFERLEKKGREAAVLAPAVPVSDDFDPFLDADDLP